MNAPLGVSEMVRGIPLFSESNDKMTSVIAYVYKNHSLAFVGTKGGRLKKVGLLFLLQESEKLTDPRIASQLCASKKPQRSSKSCVVIDDIGHFMTHEKIRAWSTTSCSVRTLDPASFATAVMLGSLMPLCLTHVERNGL